VNIGSVLISCLFLSEIFHNLFYINMLNMKYGVILQHFLFQFRQRNGLSCLVRALSKVQVLHKSLVRGGQREQRGEPLWKR